MQISHQSKLPPCSLQHAQHFNQLLSPRTRLVSMVHVSNVLGCVLDTAYVMEQARKVGGNIYYFWAVGECYGDVRDILYLVGMSFAWLLNKSE